MDNLKMEKVLNILVFCKCFFHIDDQIASIHIENVLLQKREKRETPQRDYGIMQHFAQERY
jgi:hypothetical protein